MGLFDRFKAYLNEEDVEEDNQLEKKVQHSKETSEKKNQVASKKLNKENAEDRTKKERSKKSKKDKDFNNLKETVAKNSLAKSIATKESKRRKRDTLSATGISNEADIRGTNARQKDANTRKNVADFCEQLIDASAHMEEAKQEYRVVTEYLTDIQRIEELPADMAKVLNDTAARIEMLDKHREMYVQSENLLTMDQYNILSTNEDSVESTIRKLEDMEKRDALLKSDMGYLEGEKEDLRYMRSEYAERINRIRMIIIAVLVLFIITLGIVLSVAVTTQKNLTVYALAIGFVAVLAFVVSYVKYVEYRNEIRDSLAKVNRAISLLNKVKVKYINNVNALDYIYAKYEINSSKELEYRYELYQTMVRDAKRYYQTNGQMREASEQLRKQLSSIGVRDTVVWVKQVHAIIDRREMVEIKHNLIARRQKLRERVEICQKIKDNACIALRAAVEENPGLIGMIRELLGPHKLDIYEN